MSRARKSICPVTGEHKCRCEAEAAVSYMPDAKETLRKLFTDHGVYTKFFVNSFLNGDADTDALLARLLENQKDIGNFVRPIVKEKAANELTRLLTQHIVQAGEVLKALKSNSRNLNSEINRLYSQGDEVAYLLSSLNPQKLSYEAAKEEFHRHNQFVVELASLHYQGNHKEEVKKYDAYYNHVLSLADLIYFALTDSD